MSDCGGRAIRCDAAPAPKPREVHHLTLHYDRRTYCGHPRQVVFKYFGGSELVVGHNHAPCAYRVPSDVQHDLGGYHSRAVALLQRSLDAGRTWPAEHDVVIYDETMPSACKRSFLYQVGARREDYDMFSADSLFFFGRTYLPDERGRVPVCFALRSADRGRTWERTPTIVEHPDGPHKAVHKDCHPVVRMPDGRTLLAAMSVSDPGGPAVYASTDQGLSWQFRARVAVDESGEGRFTYAGLLLLPSGELQCYFLHIAFDDERVAGVRNAICMSVSRDGGWAWSEPQPIVGAPGRCWREPGESGRLYRSPWPVLLRDGRIVVFFARRRLPMGIGAVVSEDGGRSWSEQLVIRDDATCPDLGYPVGGELEDGRLFLAYYYTAPDGNGFGGTRHIAATTLRLD